MAPLNPNNTGRFYVDYQANARQHTVMFRYSQGAGPVPPSTPFLTQVADFLNAIAPKMPTDFTIGGARYSAWMSNISLPFAAPVVTVAGTYTLDPSSAPAFISFVGRGTNGRRSRIYMLGAGLAPHQETGTENYRINATEDPDIGDAVAILDSSVIVDISNVQPEWYDYVNLGYHSYWQKEMRT